MIRSLILAVAMLVAAPAFAQQAFWIEFGPGTGIGVILTADGKVVTFNKLTTIKPDPTNPPSPATEKVTAVVYVYEKDNSVCPRPVANALQAINAAGGVVASEFEEDTVDGTGEVPDQYKVALEAARKAGLPALVVLKGQTVYRVIKDPKTDADVTGAMK